MAPVIPCSIGGNVSLFPSTAFISWKENRSTKYNLSRTFARQTFSQRVLLSQYSSIELFPKYRSGFLLRRSKIQNFAAVETDVAIEESNSSIVDEDASETIESTGASTSENAGATPTSQTKRPKVVRKSEMPPVKTEELVPGATFMGKVRSIQPFGAFVDFGAFTDGLVHVSRMSDSFVKDVGSIVSVGQEVKVRIVEANTENGRISLTMRESDDITKLQQRRDAPAASNTDKPRPARKSGPRTNQREEMQKSSKFTKGQILDGTVKNITRAGAFVSLPDGEEGFLPNSEEPDSFTVLGTSELQIGQEVNVRVLRFSRGKVTLTMKKEEDSQELKVDQGVVHLATNPFELAFRKNKAIAAFLEDREKAQKLTEARKVSEGSKQIEGKAEQIEAKSETLEPDAETITHDQLTDSETELEITENKAVNGISGNPEVQELPDYISEEVKVEAKVLNSTSSKVESTPFDENSVDVSTVSLGVSTDPENSADIGISTEPVTDDEKSKKAVEVKLEGEVLDSVSSKVESVPAEEASVEDVSTASIGVSTDLLSSADIGLSTEPVTDDEKSEKDISSETIQKEESSSSPILEGNGSSVSSIVDKDTTTEEEQKFLSETESTEQLVDSISSSDQAFDSEEIVQGADKKLVNEKMETETPLITENEIAPTVPGKITANAVPENSSFNSSGQGQIEAPPVENVTKATISPALVKQLRDETGAGMMDCKKALSETGGDIVKAQEFLRKKGLASADKKASRATAEGRIGSYIHDNRIGVLIEVNCETDFVSRGDIFKELVDDLAMQVAAYPQVQYLAPEDVPAEIINKERELEMQREDLLKKPEQIRSKIVEGRINKRLVEFALLEQPYIKNDKMVVKDWVKQTIATIGENIKVRRFVRYNLGEGLEKKSQDFAAEVAAQTAAKAPPAVPKDQPAAETKETVEKPAAVAVSAALVKQLREETGAGMMDCKKALTETGGDLEKAQEYLRKKGLSTADKKSSRLAAEGRISSYIHDNRIGVLIEVNCETDFVGRSEKFKEMVNDLAMQVVACPQVEFVSVDDIPESTKNRERELEMQREDLASKPENIREKIVEGRVAKRLGELALLEQPFIKDDSVLIKDLVKQTVAALGENIKVRRFVRFSLGEGIGNVKAEVEV